MGATASLSSEAEMSTFRSMRTKFELNELQDWQRQLRPERIWSMVVTKAPRSRCFRCATLEVGELKVEGKADEQIYMNLKTIYLEAMLATPTPVEVQAARQAEVETNLAAAAPSLAPSPGFELSEKESDIPSAIASGPPGFPMGENGSPNYQDNQIL